MQREVLWVSIIKSGSWYTLTCDICGEENPREPTFQGAVDSKKEYGWISRKVNGMWEDVCCDCQNKE